MIALFRRHQKVLMTIVTTLVILAFVWLYNYTSLDKLGRRVAGRIYGREIPQEEVDRRARLYRLGYELGLSDLLGGLDALAQDPRQAVQSFVINSYVLDHASRHFQIAPTDAQIEAAITAMPLFQTGGVFDPAKYAQFVDRALGPNGFTVHELEGLARDQLRVVRLREILTAAASVSPAEIRDAYERLHRKRNVSMIRFPMEDFRKQVQVDAAEVKARFEADSAGYQNPEKRRVRYVSFPLDEAAAQLKGKEHVEALQKLAEKAGQFTQTMLAGGADFEAEAKKAGVEIRTAPEFARGEPPTEFDDFRGAVEGAFRLTPEDPNSDVLQGRNGFVVLHLDGVAPARPMTLEEAAPRLRDLMTEERARAAMSRRADEVRTAVAAKLAEGVPFADAVKVAGVQAEVVPPFSVIDPPEDLEEGRALIRPAIEVAPGSLSAFLPGQTGGLIVFVDKPEPVDEADFASKKQEVSEGLLRRKQSILYQEWLYAAGREAAPPRQGS